MEGNPPLTQITYANGQNGGKMFRNISGSF